LFSYPRYLDGLVQVFSPTWILIRAQGAWVQGDDRRVYGSVADALAYLKAAFIDHDQGAAQVVPQLEKRRREI
jgi:hypothetical protein